MQAARYMISWKDTPDASPRFFGPFTTHTEADSFAKRELPRPTPGGHMTVKLLESAEFAFLPAIKETIARARKHRALNSK